MKFSLIKVLIVGIAVLGISSPLVLKANDIGRYADNAGVVEARKYSQETNGSSTKPRIWAYYRYTVNQKNYSYKKTLGESAVVPATITVTYSKDNPTESEELTDGKTIQDRRNELYFWAAGFNILYWICAAGWYGITRNR